MGVVTVRPSNSPWNFPLMRVGVGNIWILSTGMGRSEQTAADPDQTALIRAYNVCYPICKFRMHYCNMCSRYEETTEII